jgi:hypothetical protein
MLLIKDAAKTCSSKIAIEIVDNANWGIMEGESVSSLPRNRQQVSNFRRTLAENKESRKRNVQGQEMNLLQ